MKYIFEIKTIGIKCVIHKQFLFCQIFCINIYYWDIGKYAKSSRPTDERTQLTIEPASLFYKNNDKLSLERSKDTGRQK